MAATKRNAGLTSAVPRATLNDEELVKYFPFKKNFFLYINLIGIHDQSLTHNFCRFSFFSSFLALHRRRRLSLNINVLI